MATRFPNEDRSEEAGDGGSDERDPEAGEPDAKKPRRERKRAKSERKSKRSRGEREKSKRRSDGEKAKPRRAMRLRRREKPKRPKGERKPPNAVERAFTQVLAIWGAIVAGVIGVIAVAVKALAGPAAKARRRLGTWVATLSRFLTPTRGLLLAAVGCAVLLGLSQFVDYRGISIGADAYAPGIQTVAPAPEVERAELGSAHSYLMVPVAILAILVLAVAVRTRRWQLCRVVVLLGLVAVAVALLVDRPAGLDEGNLNRNFTGVEAKLLGGYWMQLFAGLGLAVTSFLLAGEIKREAPARARRKAPKPRRARRAAGAEGAGA